MQVEDLQCFLVLRGTDSESLRPTTAKPCLDNGAYRPKSFRRHCVHGMNSALRNLSCLRRLMPRLGRLPPCPHTALSFSAQGSTRHPVSRPSSTVPRARAADTRSHVSTARPWVQCHTRELLGTTQSKPFPAAPQAAHHPPTEQPSRSMYTAADACKRTHSLSFPYVFQHTRAQSSVAAKVASPITKPTTTVPKAAAASVPPVAAAVACIQRSPQQEAGTQASQPAR